MWRGIKLKYYAWIDNVYASEAEVKIKKFFNDDMNVLFKFDNMKELAIITCEQLRKSVKERYESIQVRFGGKYSQMVTSYKTEILEKTGTIEKFAVEKEHLEKEIELYKKLIDSMISKK